MVNQSLLSILLNLSLLEFYLLLFLDLMHVVLSLNSSLFSQSRGFLLELLLSSFLKISLNSLSLGLLKLFSFSCLSLTLLEGSLSSKSINFSLSISSLLLQFSQSLNFTLFLFSLPLCLLLCLEFLLILDSLMLSNLCIMILLLLNSFLFFKKSLSIGFSGLSHKKIDLVSLGLMGSLIFLAHFFNIHLKLDLFFIPNFLFLHSLDCSLLNLINDNLCTLLSGLSFSSFSLFFFLEDLKSLDFHHQIEFLLFLNPL